jgi:hypothetical protein
METTEKDAENISNDDYRLRPQITERELVRFFAFWDFFKTYVLALRESVWILWVYFLMIWLGSD